MPDQHDDIRPESDPRPKFAEGAQNFAEAIAATTPSAGECERLFREGLARIRGEQPAGGLKDSGTRRDFATGSVRDAATGKGRYDLVSPIALQLLARVLERGAVKYEARNWEKGQPVSVFFDCAIRHLYKHLAGWRDEDHLAAALWNVAGIVHTEHQIARGKLPRELLDWPAAYVTEDDAGGSVYRGEPCYKPEDLRP